MTLADQLRAFAARHYRSWGPTAFNLLELADHIEKIENADPQLEPNGSTSWSE